MNGEEIEEMFVESSEFQSYNQISLLRKVILSNKRKYNTEINDLSFDSPVKFDIEEVYNCITNLSKETTSYSNANDVCFKHSDEKFSSEEDKYKNILKKFLNSKNRLEIK
ncbi:hypothetical protein J4711_13155 [Staphylococcus epidermidis]|nr:hypothetical protein [Staphylococcus epidermidis]